MLLDRTLWDLCLDDKGNIALASDPYSIAQDVASACRLFVGECYYDTTRGVPYFQEILGQRPPISVLKAALLAAAMTVPEVENGVVYIASVTGRDVTGQVQVTTTSGVKLAVGGSLGSLAPV